MSHYESIMEGPIADIFQRRHCILMGFMNNTMASLYKESEYDESLDEFVVSIWKD
jgi:hypothetical protein